MGKMMKSVKQYFRDVTSPGKVLIENVKLRRAGFESTRVGMQAGVDKAVTRASQAAINRDAFTSQNRKHWLSRSDAEDAAFNTKRRKLDGVVTNAITERDDLERALRSRSLAANRPSDEVAMRVYSRRRRAKKIAATAIGATALGVTGVAYQRSKRKK